MQTQSGPGFWKLNTSFLLDEEYVGLIKKTITVVIFLDFHSKKQGLPLVDSWPSRLGYIAARDQSMVESGVTEGGKNTARSSQFSFS